MKKLQTVYLPTKEKDNPFKVFDLYDPNSIFVKNVTETEVYVFTPDELKKLLEDYTNKIVENATASVVFEMNGDRYEEVDKKSITSQLPIILKELGI